MKKYLYIVCLIVLLSAVFVSAEQTFKAGSKIDLRIFCTNNGTYCSSNAKCNGSVVDPQGTILLANINMTTTDYVVFNLTLNNTNTTVNGEYQFSAFCLDNGKAKAESFLFRVTPSGTEPTSSQGLMYVFLLIVTAFLMCLCLYGAFVIDGNNKYDVGGQFLEVNFNKYIKQGLFFFAYLFLTIIFFFSWQISQQFLVINFATDLLRYAFLFLEIMIVPLFLLFVTVLMIKIILDIRMDKLAKRGLKEYGK